MDQEQPNDDDIRERLEAAAEKLRDAAHKMNDVHPSPENVTLDVPGDDKGGSA